ncbi:MAG TPA: UDP-N-acetylmuramoyl-tripeptide--D-alanyl-D-alanine ligase [Solirubrobacteraceae bacterium]
MIDWTAQRLARAAGARLQDEGRRGTGAGPARVVIDSREVRDGDLFIGLPGSREDGGAHISAALEAGAWGVLAGERHTSALEEPSPGAVLVHPDPLAALQSLARAWRAQLSQAGAQVIAVTGSSGKTSTKDILAALASTQKRTFASPENFNTEIGLPLAILAAPAGTEVLVLEMAMRGAGQIAQLTEIAKPQVGVIVNVGPVHLELLGSLQAIAAAKAELIAGMAPGATIVLPAHEPLLDPHRRSDLKLITFGEGGDVSLNGQAPDGSIAIRHSEDPITLRPSFSQSHNLLNLLAAVAAVRALSITPAGELNVNFSALRGERIALDKGVLLINDCYNANPISMRAALEDLVAVAPGRRVAVLGDMLELGEQSAGFHLQIAGYAAALGVELLVSVGALSAGMRAGFHGEFHSAKDAAAAAVLLDGLLRAGDTVLLKGSRGVGLELIAERLAGSRSPAGDSLVGSHATGGHG